MAKSFDLGKITRALSDRAKLFGDAVAKVGIPAGKNCPDGTSIAYIALIQEMGAPEVNIPARPAFRLTRAKKAPEWAKLMTEGAEAVMERRISLHSMLEAVGHVAALDVVQTIADTLTPPLKPATVEARVRRARRTNPSFGSKGLPITISQPLNDTGALVAHISSGVGKAGETFEGGTPAKG